MSKPDYGMVRTVRVKLDVPPHPPEVADEIHFPYCESTKGLRLVSAQVMQDCWNLEDGEPVLVQYLTYEKLPERDLQSAETMGELIPILVALYRALRERLFTRLIGRIGAWRARR